MNQPAFQLKAPSCSVNAFSQTNVCSLARQPNHSQRKVYLKDSSPSLYFREHTSTPQKIVNHSAFQRVYLFGKMLTLVGSFVCLVARIILLDVTPFKSACRLEVTHCARTHRSEVPRLERPRANGTLPSSLRATE